jgi:hypothetical protein
MMPRWATPALFVVIAWLFYIAGKGAYEGFFSGDDLDNLAWTRHTPLSTFLTGLFTPQFFESNFRPVGHFYFWSLGRLAALDFRPYVAVLHALHLFNLTLLWRLLASLSFAWPTRALAVVFFAFHMAVFDAYWKPMYIFDVLCALFSLLTVNLWLGGRPWSSFLAFWLAYKSKELAVALPAVLALYELWLGGRNLRPLLPQAAGAALFSIQALFAQGGRTGDYGVRLTPLTLWQTVDYYASQVFLLRHAGFALVVLPAWIRDRRLWWGLAAAALWLAPMFLVPGRRYGAYLYLPLAGLTVAFAAVTERYGWKWLAAPLALWLAFNYSEMRQRRRATIAEADENRAYVHALADFARHNPDVDTVLFDTKPALLPRWGAEGAVRYGFARLDQRLIHLEDLDPRNPPPGNLALLSWDAPARELHALRRDAAEGDASFIEMRRLAPVWQLTKGWYPREGAYRWTAPQALARLHRPPGASLFEVTCNIGPDYIRAIGRVTLTVRVNGVELGARTFTRQGWITESFPLPGGSPGPAVIEFSVDPPFRPSNGDPRPLGIPIGAFGFR